jgi:tRNA 2-thiocytidine biosynthesis protein TtcA
VQLIKTSVLPEQTQLNKIARLEKKILHYAGKVISKFNMIEPEDRVLVCVSGGKDSITLLKILKLLQLKTNNKFYLHSLTLDQKQPGWDDLKLRDFITNLCVPFTILERDTYSIVKEKVPEGKTYCSLCSRLRRGNIYTYAKENGYNKIALGHHRDDLIQTLLMSIFYNGEIKSMPPKLRSDDEQNIVIRPLVNCQEKDIAEYARLCNFPIIPCNLCGSQENLARKKVAKLIQDLAADNPKIPSNMLRAISNISPSQLMDTRLWDFNEYKAIPSPGNEATSISHAGEGDS